MSRAEALANIFAGYLAHVAAGRADGLVPSSHQAIVHLNKGDIDAGWQNQAARLHDADALDPETARRMACDAAWRAVVMNDLDPEGVTASIRLAGARTAGRCLCAGPRAASRDATAPAG
ncbi:MAG: hypothetical protein R2699_03400 [Acidimicrobiales bacterium]